MKKIYLFLIALFSLFGSVTLYAQELSKFDYTPDYANELILDVSQLSSPCSDEAEGSLGALIGVPDVHPDNAFWHSDWHNKYQGQHFFQVELPDDVNLTEVLAFEFQRRPIDSNQINKWSVYGTNENNLELPKDNCTLLRICETPFTGDVNEIVFEVFPHQNFKYIRFYNEGTSGNSVFFHIATFQIYPTEKNSDDEVARQKLLDLYNQVKNAQYVGGNFVGAIDESLISEFNSAVEEAVSKGDDLSATADELNALYDRLKAAYEACEEAAAKGSFKAGYYYIMNAKDAHRALEPDGLQFYMNMYGSEKKAGWAQMNETDPTFIWKFTQAGVDENGDAYYTMQNFGSELFVDQYQQSQQNELVESTENHVYVIPFGGGKYYINAPNGDGWIMMHQEGHGGAVNGSTGHIVGWNDNASSASAWYIIAVDDATIAQMEEAKKQKVLDDQFSALRDEASIAYSQAFQYECYIPEEGVPFTEWQLMDGVEDVTPESEYDFYSNASEAAEHGKTWGSDGVGFIALIDGDLSEPNFYHTSWHGNPEWTAYSEDNPDEPAEGALPSNKHNLWMKLKKPVTEVGFVFYPRGNGGHTNGNWDSPRDIDVYASNDGVNWTLVAEGYDRYNLYEIGYNFKSNPTYGACPAYTGSIPLGGEYQWVRFDVNASRRGVYFNLGELRVVTGMKAVETSQAASMSEATITGMQDAIDAAKKVVHATTTDIANLQAAFDAFKTEFADPTELGRALKDAKNLLSTVEKVETNEDGIDGEGVGYYTEGCVSSNDLREAVEEADALLAGNFSKAQLEAALAKLNAAAESAKTALAAGMQSTPKTDVWYQIVYPSYEEYEEHGWTLANGQNDSGNFLFGTAVVIACDKFTEFIDAEDAYENHDNHRMYAIDYETLMSPDFSYWRFIPVGEGYVLQNKGTGLFMHITGNGPSDANNASSVPTLFKVEGLGYGKVVMRCYDLFTGESLEKALHFALNDNDIVGWPAYALNTNSAVSLVECGDASSDEIGHFYNTLREGQAYAYCFASGAKNEIGGGRMFAVAGQFEDDGVAYVGLNEISESVPGEPFIYIAEGNFDGDALETVADFSFNGTIATEPTVIGGLTGTFVEVKANAGDAVLAVNNTLGSYWNIVNSSTNVAAGTAYLPAVSSLPTCDMTDVWMYLGDPTQVGIRSTKNCNFKVNDIFNLAGQKVGTTENISTLKSGLYIIKGHKVLVP